MFLPIKECVDSSEFFKMIFLKWVDKFWAGSFFGASFVPDDGIQIVDTMWWEGRACLSTCASLFYSQSVIILALGLFASYTYCLFLTEPKHQLGFISGLSMSTSVFPATWDDPLSSCSNHVWPEHWGNLWCGSQCPSHLCSTVAFWGAVLAA